MLMASDIVEEEDYNDVIKEVARECWRVADSLDITKTEVQCMLMASDIVEEWKKYHHCSLNDILECLRVGRLGCKNVLVHITMIETKRVYVKKGKRRYWKDVEETARLELQKSFDYERLVINDS